MSGPKFPRFPPARNQTRRRRRLSERADTHPDCVSILRTELPGEDLGLPNDIIFIRLALPIGLRRADISWFVPA